MIGNNTHGRITLTALSVLYTGQIGNFIDQGTENIRVIIRSPVLGHHTQPLKTHACVDMLQGQRLKGAVFPPVILDKHQVPDFNHFRMILVHQQMPCRFFSFIIIPQIYMDFRARTAGTTVAHLPEIIFPCAEQYLFNRQIFFP